MKNYLLPLFFSFLFYQLSFSQFNISNYPIDQFKLPDIDRQELEFTGNILGDFNTQSNQDSGNSFTTSQFQPAFGLQYSRYINRADLQASYVAYTNPFFSFNKKKDEFEEVQQISTTLHPDLFFNGQWSNYHGHRFTQLGIKSQLDYNLFHLKNREAGYESKRHGHFLYGDIEVPVGFGRGRLEPVSDMAMALFLLKDIIDAGVDGNLITNEQVNEFASKMAELRNERVLDARIKRIHELRELYAYMEAQHWTIANDPGFFTVLTDNWLYNNNAFRQSGRKWTYSVIPTYKYSGTNQIISDTTIFNANFQNLGGALQVLFEKYKPVNVHHDIFRTHSIRAGVNHMLQHPFNETDHTNFEAVFSNVFGHQWIPNSRTTIITSLGLDYHLIRSISNVDPLYFDDDDIINARLRGVADYFISYKTKLFVDFLLDYSYTSSGYFTSIDTNPNTYEQVNDGFHVSLNAGISVSIF